MVKKLSGDKLKILISHSTPERDMSKAYSSNLTEWQWELMEPLFGSVNSTCQSQLATSLDRLLGTGFMSFDGSCRWH
jgi:hypothetical protein